MTINRHDTDRHDHPAEPMSAPLVELTDLLWRSDPSTGERLPVLLDEMLVRLRASGQSGAVRLARGLPTRPDGTLDPDYVDALMLRVHRELQRLSEELVQPRRLAEALQHWVEPLLRAGRSPVRVVDVGCGIGYAVRWLAFHRPWGSRVELVGVDLNATLVEHARELADDENLDCRFEVGDAFAPGLAVDDAARTVLISTGVLHHIAAEDLTGFFAGQQRLGVAAFAHWDTDPSPWATLGSWVFHRARMREPVSRHDGVLSVRRAHTGATLLAAAQAGAPAYDVACSDGPRWRPALTDVLRPVTGSRRIS